MKYGKILLFLLIILFLFPSVVSADEVQVIRGAPNLSCEDLSSTSQKAVEICNIFQRIANILTVCAAVIAVITILWGGITVMTGGGGSGEKLNKGKKILLYGLLGAAVVYSVNFILGFLSEILPQ